MVASNNSDTARYTDRKFLQFLFKIAVLTSSSKIKMSLRHSSLCVKNV